MTSPTEVFQTLPGLLDPARIAAVEALGALDNASEAQYDDVAHLVSELIDTPIGLITLLHRDVQYFKAHVGLEADQTPMEMSFCKYTIPTKSPLVVPDARSDARFSENPLVTDGTIISYVGVPLVSDEGYVLGAICAEDSKPRTFPADTIPVLEKIARLVIGQFEARKVAEQLSKEIELRQQRDLENQSQAHSLRLLAEGAPIRDVLQAINDMIERSIAGASASVLLVDGGVFRIGAADSLDPAYTRILEGFPISATIGSWESAVRNRRVHITADV